jgi:hypothetical protein
MRLTRKLIILLVASGLVFGQASALNAADEAVCYAAADGPNRLVSSWRTGGGFDDIGAFGVGTIEAITFNLDNSILYGTDSGTLGTINTTTGAFTAIGAAGTADGALGPIAITDIDGLAFDDVTGILYGSERQTADDLLVQINPATGAVVQDAFGPGVDYVVILASPITARPFSTASPSSDRGRCWLSILRAAGDGAAGSLGPNGMSSGCPTATASIGTASS